MKVSDLIELLQEHDEDAEVHFSYDYGDHWHTNVAPKVMNVSEAYVKHSEYHRMDALLDGEPDPDRIEVGMRVRLIDDVETSPTMVAKAGLTGTVARINEDSWWVKLDEHFPALNDWHNELAVEKHGTPLALLDTRRIVVLS